MLLLILFVNLLLNVVVAKKNILFIIIDDLRPSLGCYGDAKAFTPNIDELSKKSIIFSRAYAQQALCAPSRNSLLTGRRPDTLQLYDFYSYWREAVGNFTTLPQHLKDYGYTTKSIGKVFHPGMSSNGSDDCPYSWTERPFHPYTNVYKDASVCPTTNSTHLAQNLICPVCVDTMPNKTLPDIEILNATRHFIQEQNETRRPFFLAVGFQKPHIPLKYPDEYLRFHPLEKFQLPSHYNWPDNVSSVAYNPWIDLRKREDVIDLHLQFPWQKIPDDFGRKIIQSYYAAVTYIDDMIGKVIQELETSGILNNTIIVITSDHGWSMGEHAEWAKYSNFDVAVRVPLMISVPGLTYKTSNIWTEKKLNLQYGYKTGNELTRTSLRISTHSHYFKIVFLDALVELVDVFPTVAHLAGAPIPVCPVSKNNIKIDFEEKVRLPKLCSEGISLVPLIMSIVKRKEIPWKSAAFSQYPRPSIDPGLCPNSDKPRLHEIKIMGYTLKTDIYRYTVWVPFDSVTKIPDWRNVIAEELYDHVQDPEENSNIEELSRYYKLKKKFKKILKQGWRKALPKH
ncbi:iduronate 2-sulfatase isoform X2 [Prorops nasuta]|uniref:iduronate 2-sulfatase isoform X2 n=1 Tax=Prorops nasuta TaxID=863751 RepID=UPI0034D001DF